MTLLYIAIPVSLIVAAGFLVAFIWAAHSDQFQDLDTPPQRMLHDAAPMPRPSPTGASPSRPAAHESRRAGDGSHPSSQAGEGT